IELDGRHVCPSCFQSGASKTLETRRTMYDTIALALSSFPILLFWPVFLTAPASLFLIIRRWQTPLSIVPRPKIRFVLAALFALAEIAVVVLFIWAVIQAPRPRVVSR